LFAYFVVITIGELYLSPIGLSLVSKIAPARMISTMMGLWLGTSIIGNSVAGWLGSFWSSMDKVSFFAMIAAVAASAGVVIWSFNRPLKGILQGWRPFGRIGDVHGIAAATSPSALRPGVSPRASTLLKCSMRATCQDIFSLSWFLHVLLVLFAFV
jgi:hypothetical protein